MKKYRLIEYTFAVLFAGCLGWISTAVIAYSGKNLIKVTADASVYRAFYESPDINRFPVVSNSRTYFLSALAPAPPELDAKAYVVADLLTGSIIIEDNSHKSYAIASLSKLVTALTATELGADARVVERFYPLLLESNNETAEEIAESFGQVQFLRSMNELVSGLGMSDTHFRDPSGLSGKNVSSASDLFKLVQYLYKNHPEIVSLTRVPEKTSVSGDTYRIWRNNNLFVQLHHPDYIGGKSGYTPKAGGTLIALFALPIAGDELRHMAVILLGTDSDKGVKYEVAE